MSAATWLSFFSSPSGPLSPSPATIDPAAYLLIFGSPPAPGVQVARVALEMALGDYLAADASIAAIVGDRVTFGRVPQRATLKVPALVFRILSRNRIVSLDGPSSTVRARVQLDAIGGNGPDAEALFYALHQAVARMPAIISGVPIQALWPDDGGDTAEPPPTGTDSNRTVYHADVLITYLDPL